VLGGDGFGFLPRQGENPLGIPHLGRVTIGNDVDIGANTTVDRATIGATRLGNGVKLDNLVMIAHGCEVGDGSLLAGQFGMAGSSRLGRRVLAGGQSGVSGHLRVGDDARIAAQSGVASDVSSGETVGGSPAVPIALWRRCSVLLRELPDLARRLRSLDAGPDDRDRTNRKTQERARKG
jgi:UDP-3-O-[3-hydroxymyristoyl] glucosamine N-acyltransferase